jgi:L-alanine-DL-glutamate epimerase-like enolase superfamily enzyme
VRGLQRELGGWVEEGIRAVKMKVGRRPADDPGRVAAARAAIGAVPELFVDANGAYTRKQALRMAESFASEDVRWLEEPVSSDDLEGLRLVRDRAPASMDVAAGEYGYDLPYFDRMLAAVDVLQADVTRCGGVTGLLAVSALAQARSMPLSIHCAPAISLHPACACAPLVHLEWFADHVRIERQLFDGVAKPADGRLEPDRTRPGNGLSLREADARRWEVGR